MYQPGQRNVNARSRATSKVPQKPSLHLNINVSPNEEMCSLNHKYKVLEFLGCGTFGTVAKCMKMNTDEEVAIKIMDNTSQREIKSNNKEVNILAILRQGNAHRFNLVSYFEGFYYNSYMCLVFELLDQSLFDYLTMDQFSQLTSFKNSRLIIKQILNALVKLKKLGIIHGDLTPKNIMMVDVVRQPYRIKLIDFGGSVQINNASPKMNLQCRPYRAPEILFGLGFNQAIDMWSLGCIMAELFLGYPLYPGMCDYDQIRFMCHTQGPPPQSMLHRGSNKTSHYFLLDHSSRIWKLKTVDCHKMETGCVSEDRRKYVFNRLEDIVKEKTSNFLEKREWLADIADRREFLDLLERMLAMEKENRITPEEALKHPLITLTHFADLSECYHIEESFRLLRMIEEDFD